MVRVDYYDEPDPMEIMSEEKCKKVWDRAKELHCDELFGGPMECLDKAICEVLEIDNIREVAKLPQSRFE